MKTKSPILTIFNTALSAVLAILGFSGCEDAKVEYGTPYGEFQISGLVEDENEKPIEGVMVISRQFKQEDFLADKDPNFYSLWKGCDTTYTDHKGHYDLKAYSYMAAKEIEISVEDPSRQYAWAFKIIELDYKGGNGWNHGTAKATVDFTLKKSDTGE